MSVVVVSAATVEAIAQSAGAPPASNQLPPVVVEQPTPQRARPARPARARNSGAARARAASQTAHEGSAAAAAAGGNTTRHETAWGHVDGYVATRSGTATKTDTPLVETPASVSVITQDQIQAQGAQSVAEAVRYTPGTRAEFAGADARTDVVYVRGFAADQYLDSLRLLNFGIFAYPIVEPYNLERIEVLHGPASILFEMSNARRSLTEIWRWPIVLAVVMTAGLLSALLGQRGPGCRSAGPCLQSRWS